MKTKGYLVLVVSLTTMNLDEFAKCLLARFKPVAFYRFDDKEFEKYKQVVFIGQKRVSIGLYRKDCGVDDRKSWGTACGYTVYSKRPCHTHGSSSVAGE